jgi:hypothetical protein
MKNKPSVLRKPVIAQGGPDAFLFTFGGAQVKKGTDFLKNVRPAVGFRFRFHDLRQHADSRIMPTLAT